MRGSINILSYLILVVFSACSNISKDENKLIGTWYCINYDTGIKYLFNNDSVMVQFGDKFSLKGNYKIIPEHDSLVFNFDSFSGATCCNFQLIDSFLVLTIYKDLEEYPNHIDEVLLFSKQNKLREFKELELDNLDYYTFFFDDVGLYFITDSQKYILNRNSTDLQLCYTGNMISPSQYAFQKIKFVKKDSPSPNDDLSFIYWRYSMDSTAIFSNLFENNSDEDIVAVVYGYNQIARNEINQLWGTNISGNIFIFEIDTLKNIKSSKLHSLY